MRVALAATAAALAFALVGTGVAFAADDGYVTDADLTGMAASAPAQNATRPNDGQLEYQRDSFAAFCHFGPNTFANIEWGESYGNGMPEAYEYMNELSSFDADGYVKMIKDAGFSRLVVTAKHHDGFCIWQSEYTDYDMEKVTNYKNGEGDILADLSEACTKYDIDMESLQEKVAEARKRKVLDTGLHRRAPNRGYQSAQPQSPPPEYEPYDSMVADTAPQSLPDSGRASDDEGMPDVEPQPEVEQEHAVEEPKEEKKRRSRRHKSSEAKEPEPPAEEQP